MTVPGLSLSPRTSPTATTSAGPTGNHWCPALFVVPVPALNGDFLGFGAGIWVYKMKGRTGGRGSVSRGTTCEIRTLHTNLTPGQIRRARHTPPRPEYSALLLQPYSRDAPL